MNRLLGFASVLLFLFAAQSASAFDWRCLFFWKSTRISGRIAENIPDGAGAIHRFLGVRTYDDPEVERLLVRDPKAPISDRHYVANMVNSIVDQFAPWFDGSSTDSFAEVLRRQHEEVLLGREKSDVYVSPSLRNGGKEALENESIGKFRNEIETLYEYRLNFEGGAICAQFGCPPEFLDRLEEFEDKNVWTILPDGLPTRAAATFKVTVTRIKQKFFWVKMTYPYDSELPHYLARMDMLMTKLREGAKTAIPGEEGLWMDDLADYLQLFSIARPFKQVNFSIAMSHVNTVLMAHGFRGIPHGSLDYSAMVFSTKEYRNVFRDAVKHGQ